MSKLTMFTARRCRVQRIPPRLRGDRVARLAGARGNSGQIASRRLHRSMARGKQPDAGIQDANRMQIVAFHSSPARRLRPHLPSL